MANNSQESSCLLDGRLAVSVAIDYHRLEGLLARLRYLQADLVDFRAKLAVIVRG